MQSIASTPVARMGSVTVAARTSSAVPARLTSSLGSRFNANVRLSTRRPQAVRVVATTAVTADGKTISIGDKVKITQEDLTIYHVPRLGKTGFCVTGMEGEVIDNVEQFKGEPTNATFPYKVQLLAEKDGKNVKFVVHCVEEEFEVL